jgi:hypothetical protein
MSSRLALSNGNSFCGAFYVARVHQKSAVLPRLLRETVADSNVLRRADAAVPA